MKTIIGLGNPRKEFENTAHNVGQFIIKKWAENQKLNDFSFDKKLNSDISKNNNFLACLSQSYMNESGKLVSKIINYFKLKPENILIAHDDSDLMIGTYKLQFDRGSAGHKGIDSIIKNLKTKKFWRLRIGVRPTKENNRKPAKEFVLKKISKKDLQKIEDLIPDITKSIYQWLGE